MFFKDIPGQNKIKKELIAMVRENRVPHALLLSGPKGNGALAMALAFASYVQCNGEKDDDKCGHCKACHKTSKLLHPDVNFVFPTISKDGKSLPCSLFIKDWREMIEENMFFNVNDWVVKIGAESKNANISSATILDFIDFYRLKKFEGNKKISIIWQAELMKEQGNKILKLIEEPPEDSLIILLAEDTGKILPTILSRCRIIKIPPFEDEDLISWAAANNYNLTGDELSTLANIAEGNMEEFIKLLQQNTDGFFDDFLNWMRLCYTGNSYELLKYIDAFAKSSKEKQKYFFKYGLKFVEKIFKSFYLEKEDMNVLDTEYDSIMKLRKILNEEQAIQLSNILNDSINHLERNANVKVMMYSVSRHIHDVLVPQRIRT